MGRTARAKALKQESTQLDVWSGVGPGQEFTGGGRGGWGSS